MEEKKRKPKTQLSMSESFTVCSWLQNEFACGHITFVETHGSLADRVKKELKIECNANNISTALQAINQKIPTRPQSPAKEDFQSLAKRLSALEAEMAKLKSDLGVK